MKSISPKDVSVPEFHSYMLYAVGPRPICFASTIDTQGNVNLSPFSFFNVFGANPPVAVFSPARSGRDNSTKHTYQNIQEVPECVINIVSYSMVQQTSLASTAYKKGVNEFIKAGFTECKSELVKPPRIKESPVQMECKLIDCIETGQEGGAGNLVIVEILKMHIKDEVLDENGKIDQQKIDLVGRMGGNYYVRASGDAIFEVEKPIKKLGIGVDNLPNAIVKSKFLTGNHLGMLGNIENLPDRKEANKILDANPHANLFIKEKSGNPNYVHPHKVAIEMLNKGWREETLAFLVLNNANN